MIKNNPPYARCEYCGATLDKGERCDCTESSDKEPKVRLIKTPEEEAEAEERKAWVMARVGRRVPDPD